MAKNFLSSQTIWSGLLILGTSLGTIATKANVQKVKNCAQEFNLNNVSRILDDALPFVGAIGALGAIAGRYRLGDLYTPKFIPGRNKEDIIGEEQKRNERDQKISTIYDAVTAPKPKLQETVSSVAPEIIDLEKMAKDLNL